MTIDISGLLASLKPIPGKGKTQGTHSSIVPHFHRSLVGLPSFPHPSDSYLCFMCCIWGFHLHRVGGIRRNVFILLHLEPELAHLETGFY